MLEIFNKFYTLLYNFPLTPHSIAQLNYVLARLRTTIERRAQRKKKK